MYSPWLKNRDGKGMAIMFLGDPKDWARLLIMRDDVWGPKVLESMVKWFEENDGKADDFGRLFIVTDAQAALTEAQNA